MERIILLVIQLALLLPFEVFTTPLPGNRIHERSINQPTIITAPTSSNYVDQPVKINAPNAVLLDVKTTIAQVQKMLESDPTLPRLTRGEIEDLFEEVTKEEYEKSIRVGDISRAKHMRALMLVLPYNTNKTSENDLQELYNRPPITKVVSSEPKEEKKQKIVIPSGKVEVINIGKQVPTTYKPTFRLKPLKTVPDPTTYRPPTVVQTTTTPPLRTAIKQITATTQTPRIPTFFDMDKSNRFSSHYNSEQQEFDPIPFKPLPSNQRPLDPELEDILESLGFSAQSQSKKRFKLDEPPPEELSKRMLSSTIKRNYSPEPFAFLPSAPAISPKDFTKGFGANISPRDFSSFKPIPEASDEIQPGLEDYLKKFGLYPPFETRSRKALVSQPVISDRIDTDIEEPATLSQTTNNTPKPNNADEEDYQKLQELLKTLRELQELNSTLSEDVLAKLDPRHFNLSQTLLSQGPNPILETEIDLRKNEIKRQTESPEPTKLSLELNVDDAIDSRTPKTETTTTSSSPNSTESPSIQEKSSSSVDGIIIVTPEPSVTRAPAPITSTTTEEPPRNNIAELGESFAGGLGSVDNAEPLPPPRKNGFYFLSDWNSFLEVGEDPDKIIVRFDPKVGDPSRFIPVKVP